MEHAALADRLYAPPPAPGPGRSTPDAAASATVAAVPSTPLPADSPATSEHTEAPQVEVPESVKALRAESAADTDDLVTAPATSAVADFFAPLSETPLPDAMRQAVEAEATQMTRDLGLDARGLQELLTRGAQVRALEMTPERAQAAAAALLQREFGDAHEQALADARKLANRDPRVAQLLRSSNLGNDPETILQFARLAVRQRAAGRLK